MSLLPSFPSSPTNGQVATVGDYSYTYNSTTDSWEGVLGGSSGSGNFAQVFTSSGTFTVPTGVTAVKVTVIGGGGGGSGGDYNNSGGGGGGGVAVKYITGLVPGANVSVTVGAAGSGGATNTNSGITGGGTSSFGAYCSATGGAAAVAFNGVPGAGGVGSNGDINLTGGTGGTAGSASGCGIAVLIAGAGGGSSGQDGQTGLTGYGPIYSGYQPINNIGGTGFLGGRGGRTTVTFSNAGPVAGGPGTGYGNGGGGGILFGGNGGNGSPGIVLVEWSASVLVISSESGGLGYDQSWTDMTASRTFGVTYTNTTGKPIQILVVASTSGVGGGINLTIGGVALPGFFAYSSSVTVTSTPLIVPPGATYSAAAYGSSSYAAWYELR